MNLLQVLAQVAGRPQLMAFGPPDRILGFSKQKMLVDFGTGKQRYAHLNLADFMREDWELMTPEQLQANAEELERLAQEQQAAEDLKGSR